MNGTEQQVAVVTGASAGIGLSTARMLAERGWRVICTGRDAGRCAEAEAEIRAAAPGARIDFLRGDFTEMKEVRRIAGEIAALTSRLDVLINNAGGVRDKLYVTSENIEATLAANHLAPFLLTRELMPLLRKTAGIAPQGNVRVIAVSSSGHAACPGMNWDDLDMFGNFTTGGAYCQAKLANILFTRELARRAGASGIIAQCMHPGRIKSNFASHGDQAMQHYMENAQTALPDEPARTLVWLATAPEAGRNPGRYFHDMREAEPAAQALDDAAARRLWDESEKRLAAL
ncbi:SDR family NAD(P)-dependent oxidoreductase [Acidocella sp.]|uniref:SDR family NAD(P)-dependent oxidoreductase n=1 Tax=Acidocella sp. TaxID=50710 RepID=UPI00261359D1|nr:SDR family NAD(P)-dependent oxidoreductase [Acidocella sp.]